MAWRLDEQLVHGELDNRVKGRVTGALWFIGLDEPVILDLTGNPWRDLAGHRIRIVNPNPKSTPNDLSGLAGRQEGVAGDITASRKVRVPDAPMAEFIAAYKTGRTFTFHMANCLYLEWYSEANGRVVIESVGYTIELDGPPAWTMSEDEEMEQVRANQEAMAHFVERLAGALEKSEHPFDEDSDRPTSQTEAEADAHDARMNRLLDRIQARIEREGLNGADDYERIMEEEREKLRKERGEPEPEPLTPEEEAEREAWIEEVNKAAEEALANGEDMDWEDEKHPLVEECGDLGIRLDREIESRGWLTEHDHHEHPLREVPDSILCASAKLAGALNGVGRRGEWPPDPLFAGDTLVRLKKARNYLRDALAGLDAADAQNLADSAWRSQARIGVNAILAGVQQAIDEVRDSLE